jgi:hypothetical protein
MPEPPDFDQIARHAIDASAPDLAWDATDLGDEVWIGIEANIVAALTQVWNARGAADRAALADVIAEMEKTTGENPIGALFGAGMVHATKYWLATLQRLHGNQP